MLLVTWYDFSLMLSILSLFHVSSLEVTKSGFSCWEYTNLECWENKESDFHTSHQLQFNYVYDGRICRSSLSSVAHYIWRMQNTLNEFYLNYRSSVCTNIIFWLLLDLKCSSRVLLYYLHKYLGCSVLLLDDSSSIGWSLSLNLSVTVADIWQNFCF